MRYSCDGMAEKLRPLGVDLALLPMSGRSPERRVAGNFNGTEAAQPGKDMGAPIVIPCRYEMFLFNTADPADFIQAAEHVGQLYQVLRCGQRWENKC